MKSFRMRSPCGHVVEADIGATPHVTQCDAMLESRECGYANREYNVWWALRVLLTLTVVNSGLTVAS
jgi:hypothetical protein